MGPWIIDVLYQTSETAATDQSCKVVRTGNVEGTDVQGLYISGITCVLLNNTDVCVSLYGHPELQGRAVGVVSVGHGKMG